MIAHGNMLARRPKERFARSTLANEREDDAPGAASAGFRRARLDFIRQNAKGGGPPRAQAALHHEQNHTDGSDLAEPAGEDGGQGHPGKMPQWGRRRTPFLLPT